MPYQRYGLSVNSDLSDNKFPKMLLVNNLLVMDEGSCSNQDRLSYPVVSNKGTASMRSLLC